MSSNDVRSILNIQAGSSSGHVPKRSSAVKRPEGISRELYALIGANSPSLLDSQPPSVPKYREKPKLKLKAAKW
jgi:DNA methyltransferase 1-associated protein 1